MARVDWAESSGDPFNVCRKVLEVHQQNEKLVTASLNAIRQNGTTLR